MFNDNFVIYVIVKHQNKIVSFISLQRRSIINNMACGKVQWIILLLKLQVFFFTFCAALYCLNIFLKCRVLQLHFSGDISEQQQDEMQTVTKHIVSC